MITRTEAERIAIAIHAIRDDWPITSLVTLISRDLASWPLLDVGVGLMHVALERTLDGKWLTASPARVKENGPWRHVGSIDGDGEAARERAKAELAERRAGIAERNRAVDACGHCGPTGRLANGNLCAHDGPVDWRAQKVRALADAARAEIRPPKLPIGEKP
jgi:hypothetical protein